MQFSALQFACSQSLIYGRTRGGLRNVIADLGLLLSVQQSFVCITLCARLYAYNLDAGTKTVVIKTMYRPCREALCFSALLCHNIIANLVDGKGNELHNIIDYSTTSIIQNTFYSTIRIIVFF